MPADAIIPAPQTLDYLYHWADDRDVIAIVFEDRRVGAVQVLITPEAAQHVSAHLTAMVGDLDELRAEYQRRQRQEGQQP